MLENGSAELQPHVRVHVNAEGLLVPERCIRVTHAGLNSIARIKRVADTLRPRVAAGPNRLGGFVARTVDSVEARTADLPRYVRPAETRVHEVR
jgi:hypothetical protein